MPRLPGMGYGASGVPSRTAVAAQSPDAVLRQVLDENPGFQKIYNNSNSAVTYASPGRISAKTNVGNQLEYWPPDEEGTPSFPRPEGYDGKHVLEIYNGELQNNPVQLKQAIYGDLLHGMTNDPGFSSLRQEFNANYLPHIKAYKDKLIAQGNGNPNSVDDMYIRGYLSPDANDEFRQGEQHYSPQQLQTLEKMKNYISGASRPAVKAAPVFGYGRPQYRQY